MTMRWSPASWMVSILQSIQARTSSTTGDLLGPGFHPKPRNLSAPDVAKTRHTSSCSALRMLTQKPPPFSMRGHDDDVLAGRNPTSGGSSETDVNDWQVRPTGSLPS